MDHVGTAASAVQPSEAREFVTPRHIQLAISFAAMLHGEDFDRVVGITESNPVVADAKTELWGFDVLESLDVAVTSGEDAGQRMENSQSRGLIDRAEVGLGPISPNNPL
jgi:hypothetical protein